MFTIPFILAAASLAASRAIPVKYLGRDSGLSYSGGSGDGTFYGTGLGACGITNNDNDMIAAIGHEFFDQFAVHNGDNSGNPNKNPICNKKVKAEYQGKSVVVAITDRCGGCDIPYSLDFSPAAFNKLADPALGRIHNVTWTFVDGDGSSGSSGNPSAPASSTPAGGPSTAIPTTTVPSTTTPAPAPTTSSVFQKDHNDKKTSTLTGGSSASSPTASVAATADPTESTTDDTTDPGDTTDSGDATDSGDDSTDSQVSASASSTAGIPAHTALGSLSNNKQSNKAVRSVRIGW